MATNRRPLKRRRLGPQAEAAAWADLFETEFDFFDDLAPLGFTDDASKSAAAEAAWHRLGAIFLERRDPAMCNSARPWALDQFGDP